MKKIKQRFNAPTPRYFKRLRNMMLTIGMIGTAIMISPLALPTIVITVAGYAVTVGIVGATISQLTKKDDRV